ncbi:MAG: penicillin acylase family protein [Armatimonadetes bacterium]|nr:penicillin acylase family protein [Armatimonadota bacterium]
MVLACLGLLVASHLQSATTNLDSYGVAHIDAASAAEAFEAAGYAVAHDRLWQMERSRRVAEGRMAEVFGPKYLGSDKEVLLSRYTDEELQHEIESLSPEIQTAFTSYAAGVNHYIEDAKRTGTLPAEYAQAGFQPAPWTTLDSAAVAVRLFQLFGRQGGGELRNLALLKYLESQPKVKAKALDVWDDFLWSNIKESPTTVQPSDDPQRNSHIVIATPTRAMTENQLKALPKLGLLDLLPALSIAENESSTLVAMNEAVPYHTGSYAIVVSAKRSLSGHPLLLSGPQMGFQVPSIAHEIHIKYPGVDVTGLDVPGVPGVLVGNTPKAAWALTTGVTDCDDFFFVPKDGDGYKYANRHRELQNVPFVVHVKGGPDETVAQQRTLHGPILLKAGGAFFARHWSTYHNELRSMNGLFDLYRMTSAKEARAAVARVTMNMNVFYACQNGDTGWSYSGMVPIRAPGIDPRVPTPGAPENEWKGMIPSDKMPYVVNPASGLIYNWNNKPAEWWPNGDTPVWGEIFRNAVIGSRLTKPKFAEADLEQAIWYAARTSDTRAAFAPYLQALSPELSGWDGVEMFGSPEAAIYREWFTALRDQLFRPSVGSLVSPDLFDAAVQPSLTLRALRGKTRFNYLAGRSAKAVVQAAADVAAKRLAAKFGDSDAEWRLGAYSSIPTPEGPRIPYSNRGTFIQIVSVGDTVHARSVLTPGVAESGPHRNDQVMLAASWTYKTSRPQEKTGK